MGILMKEPIGSLQRAEYAIGGRQEDVQPIEPFRQKWPIELAVVRCELSDSKYRQITAENFDVRMAS